MKLLIVFAVAVSFIVLSNPSAAAPKFSGWSAPVSLGPVVNSAGDDVAPAISRDGLSLYFASIRPGGFGLSDIWVAQRASVDDPWGPPVNLGSTINTAVIENVPALSRDGHWLFFNSRNRPGGLGGVDIWVSYREHTHDDFDWQTPVNLGTGVNSASDDAGASYFENDDLGLPVLYFTSNRPGGLGGFDIYVSGQLADGSFGAADPVPELSSAANDQRPSIRFDGLELFFFSDRTGSLGGADIWVSTRTSVSDPWSTPANLGPTVNGLQDDTQAYIAADRLTLYFSSNRPGGSGSFDLYMTTRTK